MKELIEIVLENNTKVALAKKHIVFIEPLSNDRTRITMDIKINLTESKRFITKETYGDLIKRLDS